MLIDFEPIKCDIEEQETVITFRRRDKEAIIYTSDNTMLTKMQKRVQNSNGKIDYKVCSRDKDGNATGYEFKVPIKCVSIRNIAEPRAPMSEEQKKQIAERFKKSRNK